MKAEYTKDGEISVALIQGKPLVTYRGGIVALKRYLRTKTSISEQTINQMEFAILNLVCLKECD